MGRAALSKLDSTLNKKYKEYESSIIRESSEEENYLVVPTDSVGLNVVLGNGGIPLGKLILLKGKESSGKTAIGFSMLAAIQHNISKSGKKDAEGELIEKGNVALLDAERSFSQKWTNTLGVDTDPSCFRFISPPTGEIGLDIVEELVRSNLYDGILIDSLNALLPTAMIENDMGDQTMGAQARLISKSYSRLIGLADTYKTTLIFISQERNSMNMYEPTVLSGGKASRFYPHIIVDVKRKDWIGEKTAPVGISGKMMGEKNKCAIPRKIGSFNLYFEKGFDFMESCVEEAVRLNFIDKRGAWFYLEGDLKFHGMDSLVNYYRENEEAYKTLLLQVSTFLSK